MLMLILMTLTLRTFVRLVLLVCFQDNWISVRIGEVQLRALDACTRCVLVTVDQEKGIKDPDEEPLATLKR